MWPFKRKSDGSERSTVNPPVDLDTPVTNPRLVAAIDSFAVDQSDSRLDMLLRELNNAVLLIATLLDDTSIQETGKPGNVVIEKGSKIKVLLAVDSNGAPILPLFTDWDSIKRWTQDRVTTLVMPAADAWGFALDGYNGAVINPAGPSLPLDRSQLEELHRCAKST